MLKRKKTENSIAGRNRMAIGTLCLACSAAFVAATPANADILFEQLPDQVNAYNSDSSGTHPNQWQVENFSLGSDATIGAIEFWGMYIPTNADDNFTIKIYADDLGLPGGVLLTTSLSNLSKTDTGLDLFGKFDEYMYTADLTTFFDADAGTTYWLGITNDTGLAKLNGEWYWETGSGGNGGHAWSETAGANWALYPGHDLALVLKTPVPAPGAIALLGISGVVCGRSRRRKKI